MNTPLIFGTAAKPVVVGDGIIIGGGDVLPEVKFTLPPMLIEPATIDEIRGIYREIVTQVLQKAVQLSQPAIVLEFEQLYEMTLDPQLGATITADIRDVMEDVRARHDLRSALRVTVADIREQTRPPLMRRGSLLDSMLAAFDQCAAEGADILSIESTGGKEVSDRALLEADMDGLAYALGVLAPRDMAFLWDHVSTIAARRAVTPGGDTACGFGNTAMQLAHQGMIPKVLAATVRLMTVPRSLQAVLHGATGPLKDCGYENPVVKAITGVPISMEGKASACAHSSPLGNIAAAACDLWSNESVQQVRLLGGYAPETFAEILIYDARQMNTATARGTASLLQDIFVHSDRDLDPQALMLDPEVVVAAAGRVAELADDPYAQTVSMAHFAVETIERAVTSGRMTLDPREARWFRRITRAVAELPEGATDLASRLSPVYHELYLPEEYGLA